MQTNSDIKTYEQVNRNDESLSFSITRLEDYYDKHKGKPDIPHRHNFYTVILTKNANGKHFIDFKEYEYTKNLVFFVSPGQVHQLIEYERSYGFVMLFSNQFLIKNNIPLSFIEDLKLFLSYGDTPPIQLKKSDLEQLSLLCEQVVSYYISENEYKEHAMGALLKLFLIQCNTIYAGPIDNPYGLAAGHSILKRFKDSVEKNYVNWHSVSQYANDLNITPDHLNRTIKTIIGKTSKDYILARIIISAKRMLYFSDLSTKEIGFKLGFSEPSNFSATFKKCTKVSPSEFRKKR